MVLSIGLLVSNRKDTIRACLDSLSLLREKVSCQLILIDTGCDSEVRAILEEYGDIVENFVWCNDFSAARNRCLSYAVGEWFLYLDDDEWFSDISAITEFFVSGEYRTYDSASYIQRNYLDLEGSQYTDNWVGRMCRRLPETHFVGKVHEYIVSEGMRHKYLPSVVEHYGYVYTSEEAKRKHYERNSTLIKEMIAAEPEQERWYLQLLLEYRTMEEYAQFGELAAQGIANYEKGVFLTGTQAESLYVGSFYAAQILAKLELLHYEAALTLCEAASNDARTGRLFSAFLLWARAKSCFYIECYPDAIGYVTQYLALVEELEQDMDSLAKEQIAPFVGECLDVVKRKEMYSIAICAGLMQKDATYLKRYFSQLKWNEQHLYVFEEIVSTLIQSMCTMEREPIFEEVLKTCYAHGGLWEYFCEVLQSYEASGHDTSPIMELLEEISSKDDNASVLALAESVKEQLKILIANGMTEQALEVIRNIRTMLPEDEELREMEDSLRESK